MNKFLLLLLLFYFGYTACKPQGSRLNWDRPRDTIITGDLPVMMADSPVATAETPIADSAEKIRERNSDPFAVNTGKTTPQELLAFAHTQIGIPYKYASTDPKAGFDCSGFITYVFNHFNIAVPRSSVDFTHVGKPVSIPDAKPGDLILFTGTDSTVRIVGHMGIVTSNRNAKLEFIHSSSGKARGVVVTPLERYYLSRFVKVIRVFPV